VINSSPVKTFRGPVANTWFSAPINEKITMCTHAGEHSRLWVKRATMPVSSNKKKNVYSCRHYKKYKLPLNVILSQEDYGPFTYIGPVEMAPPLIRGWLLTIIYYVIYILL